MWIFIFFYTKKIYKEDILPIYIYEYVLGKLYYVEICYFVIINNIFSLFADTPYIKPIHKSPCSKYIRYNSKKEGASSNSISGFSRWTSCITSTYQVGVFKIFLNQ